MKHRSLIAAVIALAAVLVMAPAAGAYSLLPDAGSASEFGPSGISASTTQVWAGYVDVARPGNQFRSVTSTFTVPRVTCTSSASKASFWVGLDGYGNSTVEQAGLSTDCAPDIFGHNFPHYLVWWEMFPQPVHYMKGVVPGDLIVATVFYNYRTNVYTLSITDKSHSGSSFSVQERCPSGSHCRNVDAEAILEANGGRFLSKFTPVTFANSAVASRNGTAGAFGNAHLWTLARPLMSGQHGVLANISGLSNGGRNFTISYVRSS